MRLARTTYWLTTGLLLLQACSYCPAFAAEDGTGLPSTAAAEGPAIPTADGAVTTVFPDDGPRYDGTTDSDESKQFQDAVLSFERGQYAAARAALDTFMTRYPESQFGAAALAFSAEAIAREEPGNRRRAEAVNRYRNLIHAYPNDANASRAQWRVGDLYLEMGWFPEAKSAYEQALSRTTGQEDRDRAMLGLGFTLVALGQRQQADRAFQDIRTRTSDDRILLHATRGLAASLHSEHRDEEARPLYEALYRRWPSMLKQDSVLLGQYCAVLFETNRLLHARDLCTLFSNLYPSTDEAGSALIRVGDSCRRLGQQKCSELFYRTVRERYRDFPAGAIARLRLAAMEQDLAAAADEDLLYLKVRGIMRGAAPTYLESSEFQRLYEELAGEHEGDALGSEALFRLAQYRELRGEETAAIRTYYDVSGRAGIAAQDPWPDEAGQRLAAMLRPRLETALNAGRDWDAIALFHWHGHAPEQHYPGTELLLKIAEAHRRQGFSAQAVHLYQALVRDPKAASLHEAALTGLGHSYMEQQDYPAAQKVFERARFLYPLSPRGSTLATLLTTALLRQGHRQAALRLMRSWLQLHPKDPVRAQMQSLLARTLAEDGKSEEAIAAMKDALGHGAIRSNSDLLLLADLLTERQADDAAMELYREVLASHPDEQQASWAKIQMVRSQTRRQAGVTRVKVALPEPPRDPLLRRAADAIHTSARLLDQREGEMP
ncbi:MAG TPA: tetratricopeptide repeat protein [Nitrospira sp.]|nr:tetratricopeptide repeat protein [Nitrospira sp.]